MVSQDKKLHPFLVIPALVIALFFIMYTLSVVSAIFVPLIVSLGSENSEVIFHTKDCTVELKDTNESVAEIVTYAEYGKIYTFELSGTIVENTSNLPMILSICEIDTNIRLKNIKSDIWVEIHPQTNNSIHLRPYILYLEKSILQADTILIAEKESFM